ncbi:MAG: 16S rRNA (guanine(966)-N(2))-methyltransferase RsmD [Bacteroidota bacterium]
MRIVSGKYKGRTIKTPFNLQVRPTTDFAKESLFNILNNKVDFDGLKVLDLFSGTGNIGYEFISRGVDDITMVELNSENVYFIKNTLKILGFEKAKVHRYDVFRYLKNHDTSFDLIFADPPFDNDFIPKLHNAIFSGNFLSPYGIFVLEHDSDLDFDTLKGFTEKRNYGKVAFSFYEMDEHPQTTELLTSNSNS